MAKNANAEDAIVNGTQSSLEYVERFDSIATPVSGKPRFASLMHQPPFSIVARLKSFRFAFRGIATMLRSQHNAWIHAVASTGVLIAGALLGLNRIEWSVIVIAIVAVWTAEALNTALELLCDVASPEFHPLIERSKDVAAGAVLLSSIGATVVGILILGPPAFAIIQNYFFGAAH